MGPTGATGATGATGPTGANASEQNLGVLSANLGGLDFLGFATPLATGDTETKVFSLGFTVTIGGVGYTRIAVSTDGWIEFLQPCGFLCLAYVPPTIPWDNTALPTDLVTNPFLAMFWDDLTGPAFAVASGTAPNRVVRVTWVTKRLADGGSA